MVINFFLFLEVLLLFCGLALDAGLLQWKTIQLQNAADAAAQEGMYQMGRQDSSWSTAGKAQSNQNGFLDGTNNVTVTLRNPPNSGPYSGDSLAVQATVAETTNTLFMGLINGGQASLTRTSVARIYPTCIWIMNPNDTVDYSLHLASASMRPSCGVYVNTTNQNLGVDGFGTLTSTRIRVVGPSSQNGSTGIVTPKPKFGAAVKNDPLNYVTAPTFSACTYSNINIVSGSYIVYPGTYCNMNASNATVTFTAGLYIFTGGLTLSNCTISGSGVTFYFTKGGGFNYGNISISGGTFSLTAPSTSSGGAVAGVLVFADRTWLNPGNRSFTINNCNVVSDGIWYLLNTGLYLSGATLKGTNYMGLVVDNVYEYASTIYGSANYASLSAGSPFHYEDGVLVQ